jgi:hypothetical protein
MKLKRVFTLIPIMLIGIFVFAQSVRLETEKRVKDDFFEKSQSILPIYRFESLSIEPYSKFGLEADTTKAWYDIKKMPEMARCRDTGYTYIYFSGADKAENQGYLLCMVGNYKRSRRSVYFYIDRNNDLDFTNDGLPDSITSSQSDFEIDLENAYVPGATYAIKLTRFKYGENVRYKKLLSEHYKARSGKKKFTDINYCFREQRYNCVQAHFNNGVDSFSIGIKDNNVNGIFNESCTDKLWVGQYKHIITSDDLFNMVPTMKKNVFEWSGKKYKIVSIETTGAYIEIEEDKNAKLSNKLEIGKKAPNFSYINVLNKKHELKDYKKTEVYIFFWDKETLTSEDTSYLNKLNKEYKDELKIITLNHGDEPKQVKITFYYDRIQWPMGYSNSDIAEKYYLEDVSRGYYLGERRKLINDNLSPKDMYTLLSSQAN